MTDISNHTDNNAMAAAIATAAIHAESALAIDSQADPAQSLMDPQSPIIVPRSTDDDKQQSDQVGPDDLGADADDPVAHDEPPDTDAPDTTDSADTPDQTGAAGDPETAQDTAKPAQQQPAAITTFKGLLDAIEQCKGNYRKIHTALFVALYTTWLTYRDAPEAEKASNQTAIDDKCAELGIKATTYRLKLAQIAFGKNPNRASAKARVITILEKLGIEPDAVGKWLEDNGGFEAVRTTYNRDGTKMEDKPQPKSSRGSKAKTKADDDADAPYIEKARASLQASDKATIPAGLVDSIDQDAEYTAILRPQADGSFTVVAVLNDAKVVDAAYAAHGRTL